MSDVASLAEVDLELADELSRFYNDPLGFVFFAYDWDKGPLQGHYGPRKWQEAYLHNLGLQVKARGFDGLNPVEPIRISRASGHGIGKSALTAMVVNWILSTRPFAKGVVTANTNAQLRSKTWAEIVTWTKRCITSHWWDITSGSTMAMMHKDFRETWRVDAQTCKEENSESFAGLHAASSTPFFIFDEASAVPDKVQEVAEGGLTDGEPIMIAFGNPTRGSGWFYRTHHGLRHRWDAGAIDSRSVEGTNKELISQWAEDYGEDSDFFKVRVRGVFPSQSDWQFISRELVDAAAWRAAPEVERWEPIVVGVDVARSGAARSVIRTRRGRDGRSFPVKRYATANTMHLVGELAEHIRVYQPDAVFIDGGGVGGPVVDRMQQLGFNVTEVNFGSKAQDRKYANKRAEMWGRMREWLAVGAIDDDEELKVDLTGVEYGYDTLNRFLLEKKEHMLERGLQSPDDGDALALTFAYEVGHRDVDDIKNLGVSGIQHEYNPHDYV